MDDRADARDEHHHYGREPVDQYSEGKNIGTFTQEEFRRHLNGALRHHNIKRKKGKEK